MLRLQIYPALKYIIKEILRTFIRGGGDRTLDLINYCSLLPIVHLIREKQYDMICSNSISVDVGARAAEIAKIPHIYYFREFMEEDFGIEFRNQKKMKRLIETSEIGIFISKAVQEKYRKLYSLKNSVQFYDGFAIDKYYVQHHQILQGNDIKILYVGKFQDSKGTFNLLEMFHKLIRCYKEKKFTLELVGNGAPDYIQKMNFYIKEKHLCDMVTISNFVKDVKKVACQKDILVMNSYNEGFGRVTVEGMLAGCLVLGRFCGGTKEILVHKENGLCFDNDASFMDQMKWIIKNQQSACKIAEQGKEWAKNNFDNRLIAQKFLNVLETIK